MTVTFISLAQKGSCTRAFIKPYILVYLLLEDYLMIINMGNGQNKLHFRQLFVELVLHATLSFNMHVLT